MKRKLFAASLVLALLASVYTAYAFSATRGLQIYLMGTGIGAVFAISWQITIFAAILLWVPGVVKLVRLLRRRKEAVPAQTVSTAGATKLLKPRKGEGGKTLPLFGKRPAQRQTPEPTELLDQRPDGLEATEILDRETELLEPRKPAPEEETELLTPRAPAQESPSGPAGEGEEAILESRRPAEAPAAEATELLTAPEPVPEEPPKAEKPQKIPSPAAAVPREEPVPVDLSQRLEPRKARSVPAASAPEEDGMGAPVQFCPHCGHPVTGKKFCAKCGARVGE